MWIVPVLELRCAQLLPVCTGSDRPFALKLTTSSIRGGPQRNVRDAGAELTKLGLEKGSPCPQICERRAASPAPVFHAAREQSRP